MGLFDHLFKPKPEPAGEEIVEVEAAAPETAAEVESGLQNAAPSRPDPSTFLHPKNFIPRAGSPILPAPKSTLAPAARFGERRLGPSVAPAATDEIVLTLGDILSRIPSHYLKSGTHDPKRELRFKVNDLSSDIARGRAAVPLSSVARLLPDIFVKEIAPDEDTEVRLPLQKLVEQIGLLRSRPAALAVEKSPRPALQPPAHRVAPEIETPKTTPEMGAPVVQPAEAVPARETLRDLRPDAEKAEELRQLGESLRASYFAEEQAVELKAATVQPVIEHVPRVESQAPAGIPEVTKDAETPPVKGIDFPSPAPIEPAIIAPKPLEVEVLATSFAEALAVESGKKLEMPVEEPEQTAGAADQRVSPAPDSVAASIETPVSIEPPSAHPAVEFAKEPELAADHHTGTEGRIEPRGVEERIQLSLAAILRQCPPEIIVGQLPPVDDSIRITLPFAPIDRQLNTGKVEVSAARFVAALPTRFQKFFTMPPGVKIPIPLEEVFQNLPAPGAEPVAPPEQAPSHILAPAPENIPTAPVDLPEAMAEPAPAATEAPHPVQPESAPAPAPSGAAPDLSHPVSVEKPAAEAPPSPPDAVPAVPLGSEPAVDTSSSGSESGSAIAPSDEAKPGLHLPAFQIYAPPPPVVTLVKSEVPGAEATTVPEKPAAVASEASVGAAPHPEPTKSKSRASETSAPVADAPVAAPEREGATAIHDASSAPETQAHEAPSVRVPQAPVTAPSAEPENEEAAAAGSSPPAESIAAGSVASLSEAAAPKWGATAQADTSGVFAEATKTIVPPQMIRPFIMPPPPLFGLTPAAETLAPEHDVDATQGGLGSEFKLVSPENTEPTKLSFGETLEAPVPVSQPDPAQPELFGEPRPGVEGVGAFAVLPAAETPREVEPPTPALESAVTSPAMRVDSPRATVPDESRPETPASEKVAAEFTPPEAASRPTAFAAEADAPSAEMAPPAVEAPVFAEKEIETASAPVAEVIPSLEADLAAAQTAEPSKSEAKPPEPEPAPEAEKEAAVEAVPTADSAQVAAAAPIIPPPFPLMPLPRFEPSFGMSEVIPPPALQLRRLDQDALQAIFMTEETLDLPKISRLAATLPGVYACVIATRDQAVTGGTLPEGFDLAALLGLAPRIREAAIRMPIGTLKHFTIYGESYSISFFERRGLSLCAIHRARSFVPGVREKLVAIADELSQT